MLLAIARPNVRRFTRHQWIGAFAFGTAVAFMNISFYEAIARIPLGIAVVIEFLGPLLVAALGKRTWRHFGFVLVAGLGVVALSHPGGGLTLVGAFFALAAGAGWATYLFASQRLGGTTTDSRVWPWASASRRSGHWRSRCRVRASCWRTLRDWPPEPRRSDGAGTGLRGRTLSAAAPETFDRGRARGL